MLSAAGLRNAHHRLLLFLVITCTFLAGNYSLAFADEVPSDPAAELVPQNGIPLVIVRVDESTTSIDDMNNSYRHEARCNSATMEIKVPDGYGMAAPEGEKTLKYIRGRGHSTWECAKKPYKVELTEALDLFGMGASTDWALLANAYDTSLMRNRITFWLGEQLGLAFTPQQIPVDLVLVGSESGIHEYGTYCLCETIKIEESRINIGKLKKNDTANITGGYVLATYSPQDGEEPESTRWMTKFGVEFYNDSPDFDDTEGALTDAQLAQRAYVRAYLQELEDLIMEPGEIDAARHAKIAERMDLQSAADYWLLQEIPFNTDGYATTSTYLYKARDGKLSWGPLWDFDNAWNTGGLWSPSNETFNNTSMLWIDQLRANDPLFAELLQQRWTVLSEKLQELTAAGGIIDQYKAEVSQSQQADYAIWKDQAGNYTGTSEEDFNSGIEAMRSWIDARRTWAEDNKAELGHVYYTVSYKVDEEVVATEQVRYGKNPTLDPDVAAPEGYVFKAWMKGRKEAKNVTITGDTEFTAQFVEASEAVEPTDLIVEIPEEYATVDISSGFFPAIDREGATLDDFVYVEPYGQVTNPRITWTSSDEHVGTIDPVKHRVVLTGVGETTITGTLFNGVTGSFVLHVTGPEPEPEPDPDPEPTSIQDAEVVLSSTAFNYNGSVQKPTIETVGGLALAEGTDYTAEWSDASSTNAGTYTVTITGIGTYTGTSQATYTIKRAALTSAALKTTAYTWSGGAKKPGATVKAKVNGTLKTLTAGTDYTITYANNKNIGMAKACIKGKGNYTGTLTKTFKINPKGTSLKTPAKASKAITVKWAKRTTKMPSSRITGYQIQLATNRTFTKDKKQVTVKGYDKVSKKVAKLKGGTKYYIRIRTYQKVGKTTYYSSWSKIKAVTTKE